MCGRSHSPLLLSHCGAGQLTVLKVRSPFSWFRGDWLIGDSWMVIPWVLRGCGEKRCGAPHSKSGFATGEPAPYGPAYVRKAPLIRNSTPYGPAYVRKAILIRNSAPYGPAYVRKRLSSGIPLLTDRPTCGSASHPEFRSLRTGLRGTSRDGDFNFSIRFFWFLTSVPAINDLCGERRQEGRGRLQLKTVPGSG